MDQHPVAEHWGRCRSWFIATMSYHEPIFLLGSGWWRACSPYDLLGHRIRNSEQMVLDQLLGSTVNFQAEQNWRSHCLFPLKPCFRHRSVDHTVTEDMWSALRASKGSEKKLQSPVWIIFPRTNHIFSLSIFYIVLSVEYIFVLMKRSIRYLSECC